MPDGDVALEAGQRALVEDLRDQAHVLVDEQAAPVGGGDARGLLTAVLQRIEAEVGELGDLLAGGPDSEDTARVLRSTLVRHQVMGQSPVSTWHAPHHPIAV